MSTENVTPAINSFKIKGNWSIQSGKLKERYPLLTDEDLKYETGKDAELLKKVGTRLNTSLEETTAILEKDMH